MKKKKVLIPDSVSKTPKTSFRNKLYESIKDVTSTLKIAGLIFAVSLLLYPKDLSAEDKKTGPIKDKPAVMQMDTTNAVAQAESEKGTFTFAKNKPEIELDISKLPKVSLNEIRILDFQTQTQYKDIRMPDYESFEEYYTSVSVDFDREGNFVNTDNHGLAAHLLICKSPGCALGMDAALSIAANGEVIGGADLTPLAKLYKQVTGKEMIYAKLLVETGLDTKKGPYLQLIVVPIDKPNGEIKGGIPIVVVPYIIKDNSVRLEHIFFVNQ